MRPFILLAILGVSQPGCPKKIPLWNKDVYVGESQTQTLQHKQDGKVIDSKDPKFDKMICISQEDFDCFFKVYIAGCNGWQEPQDACGLKPSGK